MGCSRWMQCLRSSLRRRRRHLWRLLLEREAQLEMALQQAACDRKALDAMRPGISNLWRKWSAREPSRRSNGRLRRRLAWRRSGAYVGSLWAKKCGCGPLGRTRSSWSWRRRRRVRRTRKPRPRRFSKGLGSTEPCHRCSPSCRRVSSATSPTWSAQLRRRWWSAPVAGSLRLWRISDIWLNIQHKMMFHLFLFIIYTS